MMKRRRLFGDLAIVVASLAVIPFSGFAQKSEARKNLLHGLALNHKPAGLLPLNPRRPPLSKRPYLLHRRHRGVAGIGSK